MRSLLAEHQHGLQILARIFNRLYHDIPPSPEQTEALMLVSKLMSELEGSCSSE